MKAELHISEELADLIADRVIDKLLPLLEDTSRSGDEEILTINEVTEQFKFKKSQIYYWVSESKYADNPIPFMKAGKHLRFSKSELIQWLKNKSH